MKTKTELRVDADTKRILESPMVKANRAAGTVPIAPFVFETKVVDFEMALNKDGGPALGSHFNIHHNCGGHVGPGEEGLSCWTILCDGKWSVEDIYKMGPYEMMRTFTTHDAGSSEETFPETLQWVDGAKESHLELVQMTHEQYVRARVANFHNRRLEFRKTHPAKI